MTKILQNTLRECVFIVVIPHILQFVNTIIGFLPFKPLFASNIRPFASVFDKKTLLPHPKQRKRMYFSVGKAHVPLQDHFAFSLLNHAVRRVYHPHLVAVFFSEIFGLCRI